MLKLASSVIALIIGYLAYEYFKFKSDNKVLSDSKKTLDDVKVIEAQKTELKTDLKTEEENLKKEQGKSASNEELSDFFNNHK
jgi:hypothetical protein